jgi:hypothetical protein
VKHTLRSHAHNHITYKEWQAHLKGADDEHKHSHTHRHGTQRHHQQEHTHDHQHPR